jgi:hypothetical protein
VTFTASGPATTLVSPVPEPSQLVYLLPGLALVRWVSLRRQRRGTTETSLARRSLVFGKAA